MQTKFGLRRSYTHVPALLGASLALFLGATACGDDDDDDDSVTGGTGGISRAGTSNAGTSFAGNAQAGVSHGGSGQGGSINLDNGGAAGETTIEPSGGVGGESAGAGAAGIGGEQAGGAGGEGGAGDRHVLRPTELPFDQASFQALSLPAGFSINVYRTGLGDARMIGVHGDHVYVTQPMAGTVTRLVDENGDGVAESAHTVATGLPLVHGIAFNGDQVYLANVHSVYRGAVLPSGEFGTLTEIINDLPDGGQHALRTVGVGPDQLLYISVGSDCDACPQTNPENATILQTTLTGQDAASRTIFASGLRNSMGFAWHPMTNALWAADQGSDWRGDTLPPEELNAIAAGNDYGWPYCYGNREIDPVIEDPPSATKAVYCAATTPPRVMLPAHESLIGLAFYTGTSFPGHYQNGAFVASHGSWNREPAVGYRVLFIPFDSGGNPGAVEDFVSGFLIQDGTATFGRPTGVAVAGDGALLFSDDTNGIVYRVQVN